MEQDKFVGQLNVDMSLPNLFHILSEKQQNGWLNLTLAEDLQICLLIQGDLVSLVTEPKMKFSLIPDKLFYAEKLSQADCEEVKDSVDPLVTLEAYISKEEIDTLKESICYETICETFTWKDGEYKFISRNHPEADHTLEPISRQFEIEGVLLEVSQRQQEIKEIEEIMPELNEILVQSQEIEVSQDLSDPMRNIWNLADGRTVNEVLQFSYYSEFDAWRILNTLLLDGKIRLISDDEIKEVGNQLIEEERWEDALEYYQLALSRDPLDVEASEALVICYESLEDKDNLGSLYKIMGERLLNSDDISLQIQGGIYLRKFCELFSETLEGIEVRKNLFLMVINRELDGKSIEFNPIIEGQRLFLTLRSQKEDANARLILENLLTITPHDKYLRCQLINVCLDLNDVEGALEQYENLAKIYEKDKNWKDLTLTYQKIVKLAPDRKDIKKKLKRIEARSHKLQTFLKRIAIFILIVGGGTGFLFGYQYMQQQKILKKQKEKENAINKQQQKRIDKAAKEKLKLAIKMRKKGKYTAAKNLLETVLSSKPSEEIKDSMQNELNYLRQIIYTYKTKKTEFEKLYNNALKLEKLKKYRQAITLYLEIWKNKNFDGVAQKKNIKLPICFNIEPLGSKINVDGYYTKIIKKPNTVIRCEPDFKELTVSYPGYQTYYFYNAYNYPLAKVITDSKGYTRYPLQDGKIDLKFKKTTQWVVKLSKNERSLVEATPCYIDNKLFVPSRNDNIYVYEKINDEEAPTKIWTWESKYARLSSFTSQPVYDKGILYIGGNNARIYALDTNRKKLIGVFGSKKSMLFKFKPVISKQGNIVIFTGSDGVIYLLPLIKTFERKWSPLAKLPTKRKITSAPAMSGVRFIIG